MSSYWGHGAGEEQTKERRRSLRRMGRQPEDRRASLPCQAQLDRMHLHRLHDRSHLRSREEVTARPRARCASSDDTHHSRAAHCETRINTIPELSESLERKLQLRGHGVMATDIREGKSGITEPHCTHQLHKESCKSGLAVFDWLMRKVKRSEREAPCNVSGGAGETSGGACLGTEQEEQRPSQHKLSLSNQR